MYINRWIDPIFIVRGMQKLPKLMGEAISVKTLPFSSEYPLQVSDS